MKTFKVNNNIRIECKSESNKKGFIHRAKLFSNDEELGKVSIQYYNRTWEEYTFQSVLRKLEGKVGYRLEKDRKLLKDLIDYRRIRDILSPMITDQHSLTMN